MKKTYIRPTATSVELFAKESLLTGSVIDINKDDTTDAALSNGKTGWNSEDWSTDEE